MTDRNLVFFLLEYLHCFGLLSFFGVSEIPISDKVVIQANFFFFYFVFI